MAIQDRVRFSDTYCVLHTRNPSVTLSVLLNVQVAEDAKYDNPEETCLLVSTSQARGSQPLTYNMMMSHGNAL